MLSARPTIAEVDLAAAVIQRALDDAIVPNHRLARARILTTSAGPREVFTVGIKARQREEAVRFLLDPAPGWAGAREVWCDAANIDAGVLQRHALRCIAHSSIPDDVCRALGLPVAAIATTVADLEVCDAVQEAPAEMLAAEPA